MILIYADVTEKHLNGYNGFISVLDLKMLRNLGDCILEWVSHTLIPTLLSIKDFLDERQNSESPASNVVIYLS